MDPAAGSIEGDVVLSMNAVEQKQSEDLEAAQARQEDDDVLVGGDNNNTESDDDETNSSRNFSSNSSTVSAESLLRRRFRRHFQTGLPLYKAPKARYKWGQKQGHAHHVWASLFFDLAFVGIAFQLGHLVLDGVKADRIIASIGLFVAIFACLEMCWQSKLGFDSRFQANDFFHRVHQVSLGAVVSLSANSIASLEIMEDTENEPNTLTFSCCMLVFHLIDTIPHLELLCTNDETLTRFGGLFGTAKLIPLLLTSGSVVASIYGPLWVSAMLWFFTGIHMKVFILWLAVTKGITKKWFVPMHGR